MLTLWFFSLPLAATYYVILKLAGRRAPPGFWSRDNAGVFPARRVAVPPEPLDEIPLHRYAGFLGVYTLWYGVVLAFAGWLAYRVVDTFIGASVPDKARGAFFFAAVATCIWMNVRWRDDNRAFWLSMVVLAAGIAVVWA